MNTSLPQAFAFVDTETTGLNPKRDRVIEIGILRIENGQEAARINTLINPHLHLPPEIYALTGITNDLLLQAPDWNEIQSQVRDILNGAVFIAHNARFDYAFIKNEFLRNESSISSKVLCTVKLTRQLFPELPRYSLDSIIDYFGINVKARHRAFEDANALWSLFQSAMEIHGEEKVAEAVNKILKTPSLPSNLPREQLDRLPDSPGIYIFYGDNEHPQDGKASNNQLPLYVGKSVNIKERVKSHFSADHANSKDLTMSSQVKSIHSVITAGEIGALIRESDAIKALMPVYNRQLRRRQEMLVAQKTERNGLFAVEIVNMQEVYEESLGNIMAVYKNRRSAKESLSSLAKEKKLCPLLLGLENIKGGKFKIGTQNYPGCFGSQIGICTGVCKGFEKPLFYNTRFIEAFGKTAIKQWPFDNAILITEENLQMKEIHIINKWCYLGSIVFNKEADEPQITRYTPRFDWDIYKILAKAVLRNKAISPLVPEVMELFNSGQESKTLFENNEAMPHSHPLPF